MNIEDLPSGEKHEALNYSYFPAKHQAVIWRNWELVPVERLAAVLKTSENDILNAAAEMGLPVPPDIEEKWLSRGYVTIIRNNWHLLPYEQLLQLLGWTPEKMAYVLKEEDFLWHKLGYLKPQTESVSFRILTEDEKNRTSGIKDIVRKNFSVLKFTEKPFGFLKEFEKPLRKSPPLKKKFAPQFIYSYSAIYGDALLNPELDPFPEGMLKRYADMGVSGVWMQAILYTLCPMKNAPELSNGWEKRIENLKKLVEKASRHGIGIYLYLNEPRGMQEAFYEKYPEWKGVSEKSTGNYAMCTSRENVLENLRNACAHVFREVPKLAGAFTISMSENLTHCHSRRNGNECPFCSTRPVHEIVAEVNRAIEEGVHSAAPSADVIVWTWAWDPEWARKAIDLLPEKVKLMCVSEWGKKIEIGGVKNNIRDYSISNPGPSPAHVALWEHARKRGLKTVAKVQLNNSWECSAIPYIPVPYLVKEHLDNLEKAGIDGLMLSWTLGGYPGGNLELVNKDIETLALEKFGKKAMSKILEAWKLFSDAFRDFPFHIGVLYQGPQNAGPMNILFKEKSGYKSSMVGFPYDDLDSWRANYPEDVFENQFKLLSERWKEGLDVLFSVECEIDEKHMADYTELKNAAVGVYCHFRSAYLQTRFIRNRKDEASKAEIMLILDEEKELAVTLHEIAMKDSRIGFEATNHYAYTVNDLREKVLNCEYLKKQF